MIESIFKLSNAIRYVAIYKNDKLISREKTDIAAASSTDSDRYEELFINPALLKLTSQRGNLDCGGLEYILVRYGNFFQFVLPQEDGHVSVCIEADADPVRIGKDIIELINNA